MSTLHDIIALHRLLYVADARAKIESKANKINQKQKRLRDSYSNALIKQRKKLNNIIRTKHK